MTAAQSRIITAAQIETLCDEAAATSDNVQVAICRIALGRALEGIAAIALAEHDRTWGSLCRYTGDVRDYTIITIRDAWVAFARNPSSVFLRLDHPGAAVARAWGECAKVIWERDARALERIERRMQDHDNTQRHGA